METESHSNADVHTESNHETLKLDEEGTSTVRTEETDLTVPEKEPPQEDQFVNEVDEVMASGSELSDLESPSEAFEDEDEEALDEGVIEGDEIVIDKKAASGEKAKKPRKRKKHDPTKRKKIRKLLTGSKLNTETLEALRQEEERKKRIEEQALRAAQTKLEVAKIIQKQESMESGNNMFTDSLLRPGGETLGNSFLASLLTAKESKSPALPQNLSNKFMRVARPPGDVICISSDSEDDGKVSSGKGDAVDVSSDSSDDVICTGEVIEEEPEPEDVNNSGMHIEDAKNQRDDQGRVLVNVNRPTNEPEIFLAPQLASAVLSHQIGGIRFMFDNIVETLSHYDTSAGFGCILAHSMGLGKTLQVISFIDVFLRFTKARTVLCVVPVNTLLNWVSEFNMWLPPKSKCLDENPAKVWPRSFTVHLLSDVHKTVESRSKVVTQWYEEGGVLLLGYEMYRLLTSRKPRKKRRRKKSPKPNEPTIIDLEEEDRLASLSLGMQSSLLKPGPDLIVCDEGHRIKNSHASISQMLKNVRTRRRIVLTGYPLQNNLMEYWCMVDFVRPNFLGTRQEFSNMFERPIQNGQCADSTESDIRLMRFRSHVLHSLLKGFVQRRSHSVLSEALPHKEEHVFMIRLSEWQKKLYNSFWEKKMTGSSGSWCSAVNPIKAFSVCCKIWNHPDVLYRTVQEKTEENADLDPDFDIPESLEGSLSSKAKNQQKVIATRNQDLYNAASTLLDGTSPSATINSTNGSARGSPSATPAAPPIQTNTGLNPFGEDREKRLNYEWAKDLLTGYSTGILELSGKMVVLMQLIHTSVAVGDRILVFSQSLNTLTLIEEFLSERFVPKRNSDECTRKWSRNDSYFRLDGNTHAADREKMINCFNSSSNSSVHLFLLSTRAGCLGINLIGANRVVVFDASWNPCHDAQAVCRVYRYGQRKTCHIYRLVSDQSMEKKIYERQVSKQGMADRVVDKLNPTQVFTKQDVLSLMEYSHDELPKVDFGDLEADYIDPILINVCKMYGHWFTKKPFTHESLLLDCKDQRLTKAEKRAAEKGYERDKLASSTCNYGDPQRDAIVFEGYKSKFINKRKTWFDIEIYLEQLACSRRQSYAGFYASQNTRPPVPAPASTNFQPRDPSRPIANVRPMQSTPLPMQLQTNIPAAQPTVPFLHKSGVSVQKVLATMDIPLPPQNNLTNTMAGGQPTKINAGDAICIIRSKKGTYIRTSLGRTFAVKLNDSPRYTSGHSDLTTRLTSSSSAPQLHSQAQNFTSQLITPKITVPLTGYQSTTGPSTPVPNNPYLSNTTANLSTTVPRATFAVGPSTTSWSDLASDLVASSSQGSPASFHASNGSAFDDYNQPMTSLQQQYPSYNPMTALHRPPSSFPSSLTNTPSYNQHSSLIGSSFNPASYHPDSANQSSFNAPTMHQSAIFSSAPLQTNLTNPSYSYPGSPMFSSNQDFMAKQNAPNGSHVGMTPSYSVPSMGAQANSVAMDLSNQMPASAVDLTDQYNESSVDLSGQYSSMVPSQDNSQNAANDDNIDLDLPFLDW